MTGMREENIIDWMKRGNFFWIRWVACLLLVSFVIIKKDLKGQYYFSFRGEKEEIVKNTRFKIGPFRIFPRIWLSDVGYDGNVYYDNESPVSDYTGKISGELKIALLVRNFLIISVKESPVYVHYIKEKPERRWLNSISPEFKMLLFRYFVIQGKYINSIRRYRATSEFFYRADEFRRGYEGGIFFETPRKTFIGVSAKVDKIFYRDETFPLWGDLISKELDREEKSLFGEFYYRIFSQSQLFFKVGRVNYRFLHSMAEWKNTHSLNVETGVRFLSGRKLRGVFMIGYKKLFLDISKKAIFSGVIADIDLEYRIGRFVIRENGRRDSIFSLWTSYYIFNSTTSGLSFYLSQHLRIDYSFQYGLGDYPEPILQAQTEGESLYIKRRDIFQSHNLGFAVRLYKKTAFGVRFSWWQWNSNLAGLDRNKLFIGGFITQEF